ncbi:MAG: hypothetical protein V7K94_28595 [Nostoc sp.]|uniref:hypothetical protein n=1 Tax=Nostoc sp. TaxID=1180 RepID=UPI002FFC8CCA
MPNLYSFLVHIFGREVDRQLQMAHLDKAVQLVNTCLHLAHLECMYKDVKLDVVVLPTALPLGVPLD